jgi:outer membrane protein TolC
MRQARLGAEQAGNREAEAKAGRTPKITVSEVVTAGNNPVFVFGSLLEQARFTAANFDLHSLNNPSPLANFRSVVSASMPLYDGSRTTSRIDQSRIGKQVANFEVESTEQRVRFEVLQHYFNVVLAETALEVAESALKTAESDVGRSADRVDAGLAVQSDLLAAQVQLAEFRQQRIEAEGQRAVALASLNVAMGAPPETDHRLTLRFSPHTFTTPNTENLISSALSHRADFRVATGLIEIADRRIAEQGSVFMPDVNLFANAGASGKHPFTGSSDYTVGAGVMFSVFDRSRDARVAQAKTDKRLAEAERDRIGQQIRVEVVSAYQGHRSAEQQIGVARAALAQATEALRIVQDRYEAGLTTITELLRAETAVARGRMNVAVASYRQYVGYANVLLSIGELNDVRVFEP